MEFKIKMKARVVQFRRGLKRIHEKHYILDVACATRKEAIKYVGKEVIWTSPAKKKITGKITSLHGNKGKVMQMLHDVFEESGVGILDLVLTDQPAEARYLLTDPDVENKFDYFIAPGLKFQKNECVEIKCLSKYGIKTTEEVPKIKVNGYDIGFLAAQKHVKSLIYDPAADQIRAEQLGMAACRTPLDLETEIREYERLHKEAFQVLEKEQDAGFEEFMEYTLPREKVKSAERVLVEQFK